MHWLLKEVDEYERFYLCVYVFTNLIHFLK